MDYNDGQLSAFIGNLGFLTVIAFIFVTARKILKIYRPDLRSQLFYYLIFGFGFISYLHGPGVVFIIIELLVNYCLAMKLAGKRGFPIIAWVFNFGYLISAEYYHGYSFGFFSESLGFLDQIPVMMKWHGVNKMVMLKALSFVIDYHWYLSQENYIPLEKHKIDCTECSEINTCFTYRMRSHATHYSLLSYGAYLFYPPLYLAGPTTSYNAWISQVQTPQKSYNTKQLLIYAIRILLCFLILE